MHDVILGQSTAQRTIYIFLFDDVAKDRDDIVHEEHRDAAVHYRVLHPRGPPIACVCGGRGSLGKPHKLLTCVSYLEEAMRSHPYMTGACRES